VAPPNRRRALELLAASPDGCTEAILLAHGISVELMVELIRAGLATANAKRVVAGNRGRDCDGADHRRGGDSSWHT
jgi:hypothetical protein